MMKSIQTLRDIEEGKLQLAAQCKTMARLLTLCPDIPLRLSEPGFAGLAAIIISQQVSKASADAIFSRFESEITPLTAEQYLNATEKTLKTIGLSRPKQRTLKAVSQAVQAGQIELEQLCDLPPTGAMEQMTALHGIGPWTAEVYLMFCAGHADIFPAGDLALQEAIKLAFDMKERPSEKQSRKKAERWKPYRSVAARILWAYYALEKGRDGAAVTSG